MLVLMILLMVLLIYCRIKIHYAFLSVLFLMITSVILQNIILIIMLSFHIIVPEAIEGDTSLVILILLTIVVIGNTGLALIIKKFAGTKFSARANVSD